MFLFAAPLGLLLAGQTAPAPQQPLELRGFIRESEAVADLTVGADGIILACKRGRPYYENVTAPADLCGAYPIGSRYGPPTTQNGKPQKRKVRVRIQIYDTNISG